MVNDIVNGALQPVRSEMAAELGKLAAKRTALQVQLEGATSASQRASLRAELAQTDADIAKLNAAVDRLSARTTPGVAVPPYDRRISMNDVVPEKMIISVIAIMFIGFPLAIAFARILWRRAGHMPSPSAAALPVDATRRFDHLEQSVDAIAIEVERISENQRYLTKLLSEGRQAVPVGAGSGEPPKPH
jgi:hypothetical protein